MAEETIPRGIKDPFYRYKMPAIITKVESKGNGIKTVITNMVEVSKSLARPPSYPAKFFGFELGTIMTIDAAHNKYILNGDHDQYKLMRVLDDFIDKFIICKKCHKNPETYVVIQDGLIDLHCKSCSGRTPVDMRHKLSTFILKNPPPPLTAAELKIMMRGGEVEAVAAKKTSRKKKDKQKEEGGEEVKKTSRRKNEKQQKDEDKEEEDDDDDDVVWHTDTSKEAVEQRRKQMLDDTSEIAAQLLSTSVSECTDPLVRMHALLSTNPSNAQILAQLKSEREEYKLDDEQTARLAFLALFDSNIYKQIQSDKLDVLKQVVTNADGQAGILGGLIELGKKDEVVQKVVSHVLQHLYEEDVLSEEEVMRWHSAKSHGDTKVKKAAQVFIDWLGDAEEDSE